MVFILKSSVEKKTEKKHHESLKRSGQVIQAYESDPTVNIASVSKCGFFRTVDINLFQKLAF